MCAKLEVSEAKTGAFRRFLKLNSWLNEQPEEDWRVSLFKGKIYSTRLKLPHDSRKSNLKSTPYTLQLPPSFLHSQTRESIPPFPTRIVPPRVPMEGPLGH